MAWRPVILGLIGVLVAIGLIYFAKPLAEFLLAGFGIQTEDVRPVIAQTIQKKGKVFVRNTARGSFSELEIAEPIFQRDEIKTEETSRLHIKLKSGYEIELLGGSQAIFDIWSSQSERRPEYIYFVRGDYRLIQQGEPGQLYVVVGDEVFAPEARPKKLDTSFRIDPEAVKPVETPQPEELPDEVIKPKALNQKKKDLPDKVRMKNRETLSSAYIESVFTSKAPLFRRCQLTSLRDNKNASGDLLFSLVIKPNGQVQKVTLLQKSLNNSNFEACVSSVIERTKFKPFQGAAISLSYPLSFQ